MSLTQGIHKLISTLIRKQDKKFLEEHARERGGGY